jgi:hypothetical protein
MTKPTSTEPADLEPRLPSNRADALDVLEALAGSIEAPADWASEHDHYLYGTPKRGRHGE